MSPLLLDTHAVIWFSHDQLPPAVSRTLDDAAHAGIQLLVSSITALEVGQLASRGRIDLSMTPQRWFRGVLATPGVQLAELSPDILIASSFLPGKPPRDPMDRILIATARELGATLVTRDRALLDYGEAGHLSVIRC